ncbi:hypothetical protein IEQ34_006909 [Dendrobium chrysotoxum]|uniref:DUF4283 domain-containing protein n=1 Tax=Dendrobium chrysotoxum TaxID=161865 RepID=A0AAV7H983_DENCH|nr:hypothetical protein IEQ34_006909 [Dendrobium chrysotoxum]
MGLFGITMICMKWFSFLSFMVNKLLDPDFLDGYAKSRSFKDTLSGFKGSPSFPDLEATTTHYGLRTLWISEKEIKALAAPFVFSLFGKFASRQPKLDLFRNFFFNMKLSDDFSITLLDPQHLIKWSSMFDIHKESLIMPVWMPFPDLRYHLFLLKFFTVDWP